MPPEARPLTICWMKFVTGLLVPEVSAPDGFVLAQVGRFAAEHDTTRLEHVRVLRVRERKHGVLLDDDDRRAGLVHLAQHAEDLARDEGREPQRRLIEEQEARLGHHRAAKCEHLLLAAGEEACLLAASIVEAREELEDVREIARR